MYVKITKADYEAAKRRKIGNPETKFIIYLWEKSLDEVTEITRDEKEVVAVNVPNGDIPF